VTAAVFALATSVYTGHRLYAVIATTTEAFAILPDGSLYADMTRRIRRLADGAKRRPDTPDGWVRLSAINLSAVAIGTPIPRPSVPEAMHEALRQMALAR
jgi:hypothetical protein